MIKSEIDVNNNYFYMPFGPVVLESEEVGLKHSPFMSTYINKITGTKWKKCLLFNTGWGQPEGYERLPMLNFEDLIKLALLSNHQTTQLSIQDEESNKYGSIAVIMSRYILTLIEFLAINIGNNELWENILYRNNLKLFCFDNIKSKGNGGIGTKSYEEILNDYPEWLEISSKVKELVYR